MSKPSHAVSNTPTPSQVSPTVSLKKVIVLLSTYNGERYLEVQLDSILRQTHTNLEIFVRDDGSSDSTLQILQRYESEGKLSLVRGDNIGFISSFFWLVSNAKKADYYSFADQDDIWLKDKVRNAVEALSADETDQPQLYFSNYDYYDENMQYIGHNSSFRHPPQLVRALTGGECAMGFSTVINYNLLELVNANLPETEILYGHDYWFYLVAFATGHVIYDPRIAAKYRRHSNNVSTTINKNFFQHQTWRIKSFLINNDAKKISMSVTMCNNRYGALMDSHTGNLFKLFAYTKYDFVSALNKATYWVRYRDNAYDEVAIRLIYLIGKM